MASYKIQLKDRAGNLLFPAILSDSNYVTDGQLSNALSPIYTKLGDLSDSLSTLAGRVTTLESTMSAKLSREIVEQLPTQDISTTTIYMVPKDASNSTPNNVYTEYMYINSNWEIIGDTAVSLDGYVTEEDLSDALLAYAPINSPVFTGTPKAPNLTAESSDSNIANKAYVDALDTAIDLRWTKIADL